MSVVMAEPETEERSVPGWYPSVPSDALAGFRELVRRWPALAVLFPDLPIWRFVVDANALLQDVVHLRQLRNPEARTGLEELIDNGTVEALTTEEACREVDAHLAEQAARINCCVTDLESIWSSYRERLIIVAPTFDGDSRALAEIRNEDPKDEHIVAAFLEFEADAILTDDGHFASQAGWCAVARPVLLQIRNLARAKANEVSLRTTPVGGAFLLVAVASELPKKALLVLGALLGVGLLHPRVRSFLAEHSGPFLSVVQALLEQSGQYAEQVEGLMMALATAGLPVKAAMYGRPATDQ